MQDRIVYSLDGPLPWAKLGLPVPPPEMEGSLRSSSGVHKKLEILKHSCAFFPCDLGKLGLHRLRIKVEDNRESVQWDKEEYVKSLDPETQRKIQEWRAIKRMMRGADDAAPAVQVAKEPERPKASPSKAAAPKASASKAAAPKAAPKAALKSAPSKAASLKAAPLKAAPKAALKSKPKAARKAVPKSKPGKPIVGPTTSHCSPTDRCGRCDVLIMSTADKRLRRGLCRACHYEIYERKASARLRGPVRKMPIKSASAKASGKKTGKAQASRKAPQSGADQQRDKSPVRRAGATECRHCHATDLRGGAPSRALCARCNGRWRRGTLSSDEAPSSQGARMEKAIKRGSAKRSDASPVRRSGITECSHCHTTDARQLKSGAPRRGLCAPCNARRRRGALTKSDSSEEASSSNSEASGSEEASGSKEEACSNEKAPSSKEASSGSEEASSGSALGKVLRLLDRAQAAAGAQSISRAAYLEGGAHEARQLRKVLWAEDAATLTKLFDEELLWAAIYALGQRREAHELSVTDYRLVIDQLALQYPRLVDADAVYVLDRLFW